MARLLRALVYSLLFILGFWCTSFASTDSNNTALEVRLAGAVSPASQDLIVKTIERANLEQARLVLLELDTPGGLDHSMRTIIEAILASDVPVVTYVTPAGARAASAGTYILYASHIAAMAPTTHLGAATPVQMGALDQNKTATNEADSNEADSKDKPTNSSRMEKKMTNDAAAYIRGLAELRGRNADWAEQAVREAVSLTAREALAENVIDIVASDKQDLLQQVAGRTVETSGGKVTLSNLEQLEWETIEPNWRYEVLSIITHPNVAYLLMLAGIYGLFFELANPGAIFPGVLGSVCLLIAMYALQVLPVSYAGLGLLILGLAFLAGEALIASGGIMGLGGLIAFVIGSVLLFDDEGLAVSLPLIATIALVAGLGLLWIALRFNQLRQRKVVTGESFMIGRLGRTEPDFDQNAYIMLDGERWRAQAAQGAPPLESNQMVRVVAVKGLCLTVEPAEEK